MGKHGDCGVMLRFALHKCLCWSSVTIKTLNIKNCEVRKLLRAINHHRKSSLPKISPLPRRFSLVISTHPHSLFSRQCALLFIAPWG